MGIVQLLIIDCFCLLAGNSYPADVRDSLAEPPTLIARTQNSPRTPDIYFLPTPQEAVDAMLKLANVGRNDVVYDLGCGDGRIVVSAARLGAHSVGIDIDPKRVDASTANVTAAGLRGRARIVQDDLFEADIHDATVVTLYLHSTLNQKLRPKLLAELKPGTRIVSYAFDMGDWKPERTMKVGSRMIYLWRVPPKKRGIPHAGATENS